jgi:WhiB family redox-sensing transcriptional regulator
VESRQQFNYLVRLGEAGNEWHARAACRGVDPNLFFPERGEMAAAAYARAKFCNHCMVSKECLQHAVVVGEPLGIWGGKTVTDRRRMTKDQREEIAG